MEVVKHNWNWNGELGVRRGLPPYIVHHHEAGYGTPEQIHKQHIAQGWRGIAYHYFITRKGVVHAGRPEWAMGGHTFQHNDCIGICCEGELHKYRMTPEQRAAAQELTRAIHARYAAIKDKKHSNLNATACPGKYYEFAYITKPVAALLPRARRGDLKRAMVIWAKKWNETHADMHIDIPRVSYSNWWGLAARRLAWRVSKQIHAINPSVPTSTKPTRAIAKVLLKNI